MKTEPEIKFNRSKWLESKKVKQGEREGEKERARRSQKKKKKVNIVNL